MISKLTTAVLFIMFLLSANGKAQPPDETALITLGDISLYYEAYGEGEPLFLLHGWTQSSSFWKSYIPAFVKGHRVYAIDLRGHGRTSPLTDGFSIRKAAEDIKGLMDTLGVSGVKAIGLSYGGLVLLELAKSSPEQLSSVILIGASANYNGKDRQDPDNPFKFEDLPKEFVEQLLSEHHHGVSQVKALFNPQLSYEIAVSEEELSQIPAKTLVVCGDGDDITGVEAAVHLHRHLPDAQLWIVTNAGHVPVSDKNQELFVKTALEFFSDHE